MATKKNEVIEIRPVQMDTVRVKIVGDTPLLSHAWNAKAKRQILEKELGIAKVKARDVKNPIEDFCTSAYWLTPMPEEFTKDALEAALETARFGFPVSAFKQASLSAASRLGWGVAKTVLRTAFFIVPNESGYYQSDLQIDDTGKKLETIPNVYTTQGMIEIHSDPPVMREDMVKVGSISKTADVRYRAEFRNWWAEFDVQINSVGQISIDQILNVIDAGGRANGIGEWRLERDGEYGSYHVLDVA